LARPFPDFLRAWQNEEEEQRGADTSVARMPGRSTTHIHCYFAAIGIAMLLFGCAASEPATARGFGSETSFLAQAAADSPAADSPIAAPTSPQPVPQAALLQPEHPVATAVGANGDWVEPAADASGVSTGSATPLDAAARQTDPASAASDPIEDPIADDVRQLERQLRHELATTSDPTAPAIELAGLLTDLERPREALAALEAALTRKPTPTLHVAHAGVQRDLGQRHLAVAELESLRTSQGAVAIAPGVLFELAELQWLEGHAESALATLAELGRAHGDSAWLNSHTQELRKLEQEIGTRTAPQRLRLRDLLGNLRGAPNQLVRLRTLEEIVQLADGATPHDTEAKKQALAGLRDRAIAIGCGDENATVRARAVQLARPDARSAAGFYQAALADASPIVRGCAAPCCGECMGRDALLLLLPALAAEQDGAAFRAMHEALATLVPNAPELPPQDEDRAERRTAVLAAWRQRCQS
jgi:hypothetical protein